MGVDENQPGRPALRRGARETFQQAVPRTSRLRRAREVDGRSRFGRTRSGERRTARRRDEWRALPRGLRVGSRGARAHRRVADAEHLLRRGTTGDSYRGGRDRRRCIPRALRRLGGGRAARGATGYWHGGGWFGGRVL